MDTVPPVPKPRVSHIKQQHPASKMQGNTLKKPVPLPRLQFSEPDCRPAEINTEDSAVIEEQTCSITNHVRENSDRMPCSERIRSRNLKEEWKIECDDAHLKGRSVIGRTKNVSSSIEKSVRNMLGKRSTFRATDANKVSDLSDVTIGRTQSLPSTDIFQSISFHSPLSAESVPHVVMCDEVEDCVSTSGAPPPVYPPPPLPDESVYDEVQSVVSSHSSSYEPYCDSNAVDLATFYEDISRVRDDRGHKVLDFSQKATHVDGLEGSQSSISQHKFHLRSDSWNYCDNAPEDIYQNMAPSDTSSIADSDSMIYNRHCSSTLTTDSTPLSLQWDMNCDSSNEVSGGDMCTSSSRQFGRQRSLIIQNDMYENWHTDIPARRAEERCKGVTKSVILEFDPLFENAGGSGKANHRYSEVLLPADTLHSPYGKINRMNRPDMFEHKTGNSLKFACPPVPPRRYDSITPAPSEESSLAVVPESANESTELDIVPLPESSVNPEGLTVDGAETGTSGNNSDLDSVPGKNRKAALVRWASMKRAIQIMAEGSSLRKLVREQVGTENKSCNQNSCFYGGQSEESAVVKRPDLAPNGAIQRSGVLYRTSFGTRDFIPRRCILAEGKILYYSDKSGSSVSEVISLDRLLSIQFVPEHKVGVDGEDLHFFELHMALKGNSHLFGVPGPTERRIWMQKILESATSVFPVRLLTEYTKAGWCFMKEGVSGTWTSGWILAHKRTLFYCLQDGTLQEADLRKARCIVLQDSKPEAVRLSVTEEGPLILVDFPGQALYLQTDIARETVAWHGIIRAAAVDNGLHLSQQQLTREEIPVIIDKCINFVYAHGSMSQGMYRRSGANSNITRLLTLFQQDAWAVQITRQEYTEYDVGSVLKRFLRDLPEPLLTTELHSQLCEIAAGKRGSDKAVHYRRILEQLPPINYLTTRKIIGHLHFIHEQHDKNLMPVENLAAIWGPTLMHIEGDDLSWFKLESAVVSDLILLFSQIFEVDAAELLREKRMLEVLERYHSANSSTPQNKPSGDLKIWIYLERKGSSNCVNVTVGPQILAGEMCIELASKTSLPAHELCLEEVVCGGALTRPLHHTERVLDVVLRWGYWSDVDRKDNCLVLCQNTVLKEAAGQANYPLPLCRELHFADRKSKSFKPYLFEFSQAKLYCYKDKSCSIKVGEWKIEDIIWYLGYESKRTPQMRWAITFIVKSEKPERSKENPYFGCTIAGPSKEDQVKWIGAMLAAEHPQNVLPSPVLLQ